jgi:outer membrane protein TolC
MRSQRVLFGLLLSLVVCNLSHSNSQKVTDLKTLISVAKENSPEFQRIDLDLEKIETSRQKSYAELFPSLKLESVLSKNGNQDPEITTPWQWQSQITLKGTLFDNGENLTRYQIAGLNLEKTQLESKYRKNKLTSELVLLYFKYSLKNKLMELSVKQNDLLNKQFKQIENLYKQGLKTQKDFLRFKAQVSRSLISLNNLSNELHDAKLSLFEKLGFEETPALEFVPMEFEKNENIFERNPTINKSEFLLTRVFEIQSRINSLESSLVTRTLWPQLNMTAGAHYSHTQTWGSGSTQTSTGGFWGWNIGLGLEYILWDFGAQRKERQIARLQNKIQDFELRQNYLSSMREIDNLAKNFLESQKNLNLYRDLLKLEKNNLDTIELEYRNGKAGYLELIAGLNDFSESQVGYYTAFFNFIENQVQIDFYNGTLYEKIHQ